MFHIEFMKSDSDVVYFITARYKKQAHLTTTSEYHNHISCKLNRQQQLFRPSFFVTSMFFAVLA